jgi:hypothetical protein
MHLTLCVIMARVLIAILGRVSGERFDTQSDLVIGVGVPRS